MNRGMRERERENVDSGQKIREIPAIKTKEWAHTVKDEEPQQIKLQIYNFLVTEGLFDVARTFAEQSGMSASSLSRQQRSPGSDPDVTAHRLQIKNLIRANRIDEAITKLGEFAVSVSRGSEGQQIVFSLLCLKVVNLIQQGELQRAISVAQQELLPLARKKNERVLMLERVMSLVAFVELKECESYELLNGSHKIRLADRVNTFLLGDGDAESMKLIAETGRWVEKRLEQQLSFPRINPWAQEIFQ